MSNKIDLKRMCDHCYHILDENEDIFGFIVIDDNDFQRGFKGHEDCVKEMSKLMKEIHNAKGNDDSE